MAGAGYKLFNTGDVLTAAQVNTYLMQQTVMVFASSAARTSALSGVLAEGMVSYLQDTNTLEVYDGSAWVGATGDITGLTAGTGISISSATGPVPTITSDVATTFDAKGDLVVGTGADTFSKLTVGNSGDTIVADSSTTTGLRYNPQNALANPVINGGFDIWQRGTAGVAGTATGAYFADRFSIARSVAGSTGTRQSTSDTTNLPNIQYCARIARDSGNTSTNGIYIAQSIESINSIPYAGKTITFSFYARKGANFSAASDALSITLATGTGTDQNILSGFTGSSSAISQTATLTSTWQRFAFSATLSSTLTQIGFYAFYTPVGTAGANDWFEITGFQIDLGTYTASSAPAFRRSGGTLAGELAACQRYFQVLGGDDAFEYFAIGSNTSTTDAIGVVPLKQTMRTSPTLTFTTASNYRVTEGVTANTVTSAATNISAKNTVSIQFTTTGLTLGRAVRMLANNTTAATIQFSSEL